MAILSRPRLFSHPCPTAEFAQAEGDDAAREIERAEADADAARQAYVLQSNADDPDPTPPTAGRLRAAPRAIVEAVARILEDDMLIAFIGQPHLSVFDPELVIECYSAEVVNRLSARGFDLDAAA